MLGRGGVVMVVGLLVAGVALAASLSDFKDAADRKGCEAIPYSDLRSTCQSKSRDVDEWCKGGRGKWSCQDLDPAGLLKQIENVKAKVQALKREKEDLERARSNAKDDSERSSLADKIASKENTIRELEKKLEEWNRKLEEEKGAAKDRMQIGEKCLENRVEVTRVFQSAKERARNETDPEIKPYAEKLVRHYEDGERGHAEEISLVRRGVGMCKSLH